MADAKDAVELFPNPIASDPHPLSLHPHSSLTSLLRQVVDGEDGQGRGGTGKLWIADISNSYRWRWMWSPTLSHNFFDHHVQPNMGVAGCHTDVLWTTILT
ncbi:hypothetical protein ZWY2020_041032 [Hordeum vulgare]|nr:hypothetical protein ZWY2020_041032 [Hordeum vulgare]